MKKDITIRNINGSVVANYETFSDEINISRDRNISPGLYLIETKVEHEMTTSKIFFR